MKNKYIFNEMLGFLVQNCAACYKNTKEYNAKLKQVKIYIAWYKLITARKRLLITVLKFINNLLKRAWKCEIIIRFGEIWH